MPVETLSIELNTKGDADILDITQDASQCLGERGLQNGTVTVFCQSSTSALTTLEYESGCISELRRLFDEIVTQDREYAHNARWGDGNGHSHVRAALLGPSLTIPFVERQLTLGTWQQIIYVDFDNKSRQRRLVVQVMGE